MAIRAACRVIGGGLALLVGVCLLSGCEVALSAVAERPPLLLEVDEVGPPTIEQNTPLVIHGSGFPERREGELALRGEVFVPGEEPKEVEVSLPVLSDSRSKAHAVLGEQELLRLVRGARHATFVGNATVQFLSPGASTPLVGEMGDVVLDLYSTRSAKPVTSEAAPFPAYLGVTVTPDLRVGSIESGSIAEQAGLVLGDQLKRLDGVRLDSMDDLVPRARAKVSRMMVLRAGDELVEVSLPRASFEPGLVSVGTKVLLWVACALIAVLLAVRLPRYFSRVSWELKRSSRAPESDGFAAHAVLVAVLALLWSSLFRPSSVLARVDLLVLLGVGVALDLALAFAFSPRIKGRFSLWNGFTSVAVRVLRLVPLLCALLVGAADSGSLASADLSRRSIETALGLGALASPWMLALAILSFGSVLPSPKNQSGPASTAARYASATALVAKSAVWATLFLWETQGTGKLSSLLLSLKISLTVICVQLCARKIATLGVKTQERLVPRWGLWVSLVCLGLGVFLPRLSLFPIIAADVAQVSLWLLVSIGLVTLMTWLRGENERGRALDPWV